MYTPVISHVIKFLNNNIGWYYFRFTIFIIKYCYIFQVVAIKSSPYRFKECFSCSKSSSKRLRSRCSFFFDTFYLFYVKIFIKESLIIYKFVKSGYFCQIYTYSQNHSLSPDFFFITIVIVSLDLLKTWANLGVQWLTGTS